MCDGCEALKAYKQWLRQEARRELRRHRIPSVTTLRFPAPRYKRGAVNANGQEKALMTGRLRNEKYVAVYNLLRRGREFTWELLREWSGDTHMRVTQNRVKSICKKYDLALTKRREVLGINDERLTQTWSLT